jgi:hypothetical protein
MFRGNLACSVGKPSVICPIPYWFLTFTMIQIIVAIIEVVSLTFADNVGQVDTFVKHRGHGRHSTATALEHDSQ